MSMLLLLVVSAAKKIWRRRIDALIRIDTPASCWNVRTHVKRQSFERHWSD